LIFITLGAVLPHDELIKKIDELKVMGTITDKIYAQIGNGEYIPNHMTWLRFVGNMEEACERADIIISACGAATIFENVIHGRRLIVVQTPGITGGHEWELVAKLEKLGCLIWCQDISNIQYDIREARYKDFKKFEIDKFDISTVLEVIEGRQ